MINELLILIILLSVFLFFPLAIILILFNKRKELNMLESGMNLVLYSVILPQETTSEEKQSVSVEEYIKVAEQFYSSLSGIRRKKGFFNKVPYFVLEIAVPKTDQQIYFYFACPRDLSQLIEKQILAFWPRAQIQVSQDYNIFNSQGSSWASQAILAKPSVLPIKTFQEFKVDPLSSITNVLTKLEEKSEGAAIQFIFRPSQKNIKSQAEKIISLLQKGESVETALKGGEKGKGEIKAWSEVLFGTTKNQFKDKERELLFNQKLITPVHEQAISAISQKANQFLFDVNLRVVSSAGDEIRAKIILEQLQSAFEQFKSPVLNYFKFINLSGRKLRNLFYKFSFRIFDNKKSILLSSSELAGLFHFPNSELATPYIKWLKGKQVPAPADLPKNGLLVGKNIFRGQEKKVYISEDDRLRHFYIIGQTGTGKSALLLEMIRQDIIDGRGVALIDPHGDLAERVLGLIPPSRAEDVIYFNPADIELPLGLNILEYDAKYPESKTFVANELLEIFEKLYSLKEHGFGGPMFEQYMRNSILLAMEDPTSNSTLVEIPKILSDSNFRRYKLARCKNIVVKNFWEMEAEKAGGEASLANMVPYITSKLNIFIANDLVRPIISQPKSSFNFREVMDKEKILIVNLAKGKLGDTNSFLLGMIIIGKILMAAFSRVGIPEEKRKKFFLYIDEFHNVTTKTISAVLAEARKYCLAMIFAHQFIGQLDEETRKAVFGNVGSMLAFRIGPDDAKYLVTQFEPIFDENDLVNLDNFNAVLRLLINGETSRPFNIVTYPPFRGNPKTAELIKELSRRKYGRNRDLVEAELSERLRKIY